LLQYWWDTYKLATSTSFEEATFQAHVAIGAQLLAQYPDKERYPVLFAFENSLRNDFSAGFKLTTGLSMEVLWKQLRPIVVSKLHVMRTLAQLEALAVRFDVLRWGASMSVTELGGIMTSLVKAYNLVLTSDVDGASLVQLLSKELDALESTIGAKHEGIKPFLVAQFEALRQFNALEVMRSSRQIEGVMDVDTVILANHPTTSEMRLSSSSKTSRPLQSVDYLWGLGDGLQPIMDSFSASMLHRLDSVGNVDLRSLKLLESELPIMGEKLASLSATLGRNQLLDLNATLTQLMIGVVSTHDENLGQEYTKLMTSSKGQRPVERYELSLSTASTIPDHLKEVFACNFNLAFTAITASNSQPEHSVKFSSIAWVNFAIGCLTLYVPDRAFDPDKRQRLERERHIQHKESLENKLGALRQFECLFSGQDSNIRIQLLEEEIAELGEPTETLQEIYRPEVSELDQFQGEFKNLLKTVVQSDTHVKLAVFFESGDEPGFQEIKLLQNNVIQIIRRLSERFRAYNDLTMPIISMLRCLQIGLHMATLTMATTAQKTSPTLALSKFTPFLGGGPLDVDDEIITDRPIEYLAYISTISAAEGLSSFEPQLRQILLKCFHDCYEQWMKRLESDRLEAESKGGLYRFKGSVEDEEEEDQEQFNELFPTYEEESTDSPNRPSKPYSARDTAVKLADIHSNIFLGGSTPSESLRSLIRQISKQIGSLHEDGNPSTGHNMDTALLPGTLLLLSDQIESLSATSTVAESYNFYTSANLPEARKLVTLIHQIQARFQELQAVDEIGHMQPLEDVLVSCRELLQFQHTEPLAKIITKVEKVHSFMHEWQFGGWASRANSVLSLYDNITQTIVSWRRLELSTWAKLFDMETKTCEDDARSWWFVAYQVIVAAPLAISRSESELKVYAQKLLQDLEAYFSTAIMGQFLQRLQLLRQLQQHLRLLVLDVPYMAIIRGALTSFIALYSRYENPVAESLKRGRASLEKAMRDVLLLASWKDTNIIALRDSAKRSHHKLFKIVRKFRGLLGQPMEGILKQGLPDETYPDHDTTYEPPMQLPTVDQKALQLCADVVPKWSQKGKRLINVSKTVSRMADAIVVPHTAVRGSAYLDSFLANTITSTTDLQKATPSILTEDNKDSVKHLKSQKRKLFADTLKELRQMGIKYNLGANALAEQDSLSGVLANVQELGDMKNLGDERLEYYFHQSIDLASRVREATRQHSEDLSSAEVGRSVGFLEGLLQTLLAQRNRLASSVAGMMTLEQRIKMAKCLWAPKSYNIRVKESSSSHVKLIRWLPNILNVGLDLIKVHSKLGNIENQAVQGSISVWINIFEELVGHWNSLVELPTNIVSTQRQELERLVSDSAAQLAVELGEMGEKYAGLGYILNQILPWTAIESSAITDDAAQATLSDLDQKLSIVCDTVLVAIERYKQAISELPISTEDLGWLIKTDTVLANSIKSLHSSNITEHLDQAFSILRGLNLEDDQTSKAAGAIFAVALPILEQYFNTLQQSVTRYAQLHRATCKTSYVLAKTFIQIASQGFCTPSEKSEHQSGKTEKLEGGTGLGDGDGAEDISRDIGEDEDLNELAQEQNQGENGDMEDEQDAVDMADGEMEGEVGDGDEEDVEDGSGDESGGEEIDEEAGDVDDLDPGAVDEKLWDGDGEQAEKDQEGDDSKGKPSEDEQIAAQDNNKEATEGNEGEEDDDEAAGAEQSEEVTQQDDIEKHDPHAQEGEALDLPDDMELDGNEDEKSVDGSDDGMDDGSDIEQDAKEADEVANDGKEDPEAENMDTQEDQDMGDNMDVIDLEEEDQDDGDKTQEAGESAEADAEVDQPDEHEGLLQDRSDEANADAHNAVSSDVQGVGEDQDENSNENQTESSSKAKREDGTKGGDSSEQNDAAAEDGEKGRQADGDAPQDSREETQDSPESQPFKRLGDALESWHRQQTQIRERAEQQEQGKDRNPDPGVESSEFQHLQDENAEADTQALGNATEEQAHALDESMAVETESKDIPDTFQLDEFEQDIVQDDVMDLEDPSTPKQQDSSDAYEGRAGALINQAREDSEEDLDDPRSQSRVELEEDVEEVDTQLDRTHLDQSLGLELRSAADARQQWTHYESITRDLSLSLTEQLRLILALTLATKMRGDFRTGKRLNIKRIIPYIASKYKRDKIWMRRSVPSKRSYQIMLAVDDSKSMGESGSGSLAFETLVMVSKSLSMLEVGQICVVGFGENVKVAHDFETPFSSDSGPKIFQNFSFKQTRTDVTKLVRECIELFRTARAKVSSSPADLWQMQLIISDGVCDSSEHEPIRRLLREALEERIMMVFVIVDDVRNKKKGESVMDLKEAKFVKDESTGVSKVKVERYLDTFPFQYYLIVSDVKELPGILATLLRQWFAEVVDSSN
jgi:midasin